MFIQEDPVKLFSYVAVPAENFERALAFYSEITGGHVRRNPSVPFPMAYFFEPSGKDIGHLFQLPGFRPSGDGVIVYIEVAEDLDATLGRVVKAGGKLVMPKTMIAPGKGHWAQFLDTEGNRLALHSIP
jgi:uncharacterized protein